MVAAEQKHTPDGENVGGADAASLLAPLVMQVVGAQGDIMSVRCRCCEKKQKSQLPRVCPECDHAFKGNGWDGIDAHWRAKHEDVMRYEDFWASLCREHRGSK